MAKKKVVKSAPIIEQFIDLASTQRELADELGSKFLEFCSAYLNEKCVLTRNDFDQHGSFSPVYLNIEASTKKPTSYTSRVSAYVGNVSFELTYDALGEEYDDDHFKDELIKFLNK